MKNENWDIRGLDNRGLDNCDLDNWDLLDNRDLEIIFYLSLSAAS
jgi:hypothetical protein